MEVRGALDGATEGGPSVSTSERSAAEASAREQIGRALRFGHDVDRGRAVGPVWRFAVEGLDLYAAVRRHGCWPWRVRGPREVGAVGYVVAELIRLVIGSVLASALAESSQVTTAFGALAVGVAAPLIVERLTRAIPLTDAVQHPALVTAAEWLPTASGSELNGRRTPVEAQHAWNGKINSVPGVEVVSWAGWEAIDAAERALGAAAGRTRIKIADRTALLIAAANALRS